jgi:hypothetical protein
VTARHGEEFGDAAEVTAAILRRDPIRKPTGVRSGFHRLPIAAAKAAVDVSHGREQEHRGAVLKVARQRLAASVRE